MSKTRRNHAPTFKAKVALEAQREELTIDQIAAKYKVHPSQVTAWKKLLRSQAASVFSGKADKPDDSEKNRDTMLAKIGQLTLERDFLARVLDR